MHKNWNITVLFIIHEDFDRAWAEHYPITLIILYYRRCLLLCISRIVQTELDDFVEYWNTHKLRKNSHADCPQGIPNDLYDMPELVSIVINNNY